MLKEKILLSRIPVKLFLKNEGEIKTFQKNKKMRELEVNKPALQEMLKKLLREKENYIDQKQIYINGV